MNTFGKYEIIEELGSGSYGTVYKARDTILDRIVALKVLKPAWMADPRALDLFSHEARAAANPHHSRIATIYDFVEAEGRLFFVMRFIEGRPLDQLIRENGPIPWEKALEILRQVSEALDYAHKKRFIYRDVSNHPISLSAPLKEQC